MDGFDGIDIDAGLLNTDASDAIGVLSFNNTADFNAVMSLFNDLDNGNLSFEDFRTDTFWDVNDSFDSFNDFLNDFFGWDGDDEPEPNPDEEEPIDEVIVTAERVNQWQPSFFFDFDAYFANALAGLFDIAPPGLDMPDICVNIASPPNATGLNAIHAEVLRNLLAALENTDVTAQFTDSAGTVRTASLQTIIGNIADNTIVSGDLDAAIAGTYDPNTGIITIGNSNTGLFNTLGNMIHEAIHAWADESTVPIPQDATGGGHAAWVQPLAEALRQAILQASPSSFNTNPGGASCST